jgi:hypothetical protein
MADTTKDLAIFERVLGKLHDQLKQNSAYLRSPSCGSRSCRSSVCRGEGK